MKPLSYSAKAYITVTGLLGLLILMYALPAWRPNQMVRYGCYLAGAILTSQMKVRLPGIMGTISVNFLFILIGIIELDLPQTLTIGAIGILAQIALRAAMRLHWIQLTFNLSSITIASACSFLVSHSAAMRFLDGSLPALLIVATGTFFLVNTLSVSGVIALTEGKTLWTVWKESFIWTAPHYLVGASLAGIVHTIDHYFGWQMAVLALPVIYFVYRSFGLYLERLAEEKKHITEMADLHLRTIEALALAIDAKDDTTHDHLRRVKVYATEIGKELGLEGDAMQALQTAALLHDIGKLAVPEHIISKPGKLTPEEFEKMKIHPVVGAEILQRVRFPYAVAPIVRSHHERWNGAGYPDGLKGEEIPLGARILAVVDCMDALASDRQYRRAFPLDEALKKVEAEAGSSFDPHIVEILSRRCIELEQMARTTPLDEAKLSTNARIERGAAPAAGFESMAVLPSPQGLVDGLSSIAAARQEFQMLFELLSELGSSLSLDDTLSLLVARVKRMIPHDTAAIYLCRGDRLVPQFVQGEEVGLFSSLHIPMGHGLSGWVAENGRPIVNGNPSVEPGYLNDPNKFSRMRSAISVPLDGRASVVSVLTLYHSGADAFTKDHLRMLLAIGSKAGLAIENTLKYQQVENSSATDQLTGLPNTRSLFLHLDSELARAIRADAPLAVVLADLDGFKQINDRFGHLVGNEVLQGIAERLKESCRKYDYVARMGGDEFVLILPDSGREGFARKVEVLRELAHNAARAVCGEDILSLSAGGAFFPEDGADVEQLLALADKRMYQAKDSRHASKLLLPRPNRSVEVVRDRVSA